MVIKQAKKIKQHILRISRAMLQFKRKNRQIREEIDQIQEEINDIQKHAVEKKDTKKIENIKSRINNL